MGTALNWTLAPISEVQAVPHAERDLSSAKALQQTLRSRDYDVIVNAAAYTQVDQAELDESSAMTVNAKAPGKVATEARARLTPKTRRRRRSALMGAASLPERKRYGGQVKII